MKQSLSTQLCSRSKEFHFHTEKLSQMQYMFRLSSFSHNWGGRTGGDGSAIAPLIFACSVKKSHYSTQNILAVEVDSSTPNILHLLSPQHNINSILSISIWKIFHLFMPSELNHSINIVSKKQTKKTCTYQTVKIFAVIYKPPRHCAMA